MPVLRHALQAQRSGTAGSLTAPRGFPTGRATTMDRTLIVAPSWVGDAILAEPLLAMLREPYEDPTIDVLAPPWCAPVFRRMRGVRRIIEHPMAHGRFEPKSIWLRRT